MTSRPKSHENVYKPRSLQTHSESRCRRSSNASSGSGKSPEKTVAEISMKDFLDFLKISYQVNEAVEGDDGNIKEKVNLDWKRLTSNALVNKLIGQDRSNADCKKSLRSADTDGSSNSDSKTDLNKTNSESCNKVPSSKTSCQTLEQKYSDDTLPIGEQQTNFQQTIVKVTKRGKSEKGDESGEKGDTHAGDKLLKKKLSEVLQEGILDSVLPYLLPKQDQQPFNLIQPPIKKLLLSNDTKKNTASDKNGAHGNGNKEKREGREGRRKSVSSNESVNSDKSIRSEKKDVEVVIHVCDEIKNLKKDFKCSQKLLITEMGYFADVTSGQKLEDMDISVHCDVAIFDWLMKWVQRDPLYEGSWPRLDPAIVVPVLLSSAFLQMDTLQEHCLKYCKYNINDILRDSSSLNCLNDSILTRFANMFSNTEIENLKDRKDKLQSRLYCKLIVALTEPQPQPQRGHFSTVATMYRCSRCSKLILRNISSSILCVPSCMMMDRNGFIISSHVRDPTWNLTDYVKSLKLDLKLWKKVYWRLWSDCHLLFCHTCSSYFPVHQMYWCRYHTEPAQFFVKDNQRSYSYPVGRYPCCGERAYRFEILKNKLGCQYREHATDPKSSTEIEIYKMWNEHRDLIKADPPPIVPPSERIRHYGKSLDEGFGRRNSPVKDPFWWEGLQLVPQRPKIGLLATIWDKIVKKDDMKTKLDARESRDLTMRKANQPSRDLSSSSDSSDQQSSGSEAGDSEDSGPVRVTTKGKATPTPPQSVAAARWHTLRKDKGKRKKKRKNSKASCKSEGQQFWLAKLSTRCNQDNQREFEERAFRQIETMLARKVSGDTLTTCTSRTSFQSVPPGGIYVKLEQEWREAHCNVHGCPASSVGKAAKGSVSSHGNGSGSGGGGSSSGTVASLTGRSRSKSQKL